MTRIRTRIRKRYYCTKCKKYHNTSSKICRKHRKYLATPEGKTLEIIYEKQMKVI